MIKYKIKTLKFKTDVFLRNFWIWIKNRVYSIPKFIYTTSNWIPIIGYTLAISTFWNLLGFFNPSVSFDITNPYEYTDSVGIRRLTTDLIKYHDLDDFRHFYKINILPLPDISNINTKPNILKKIFAPNSKDIEEEKHPGLLNVTPGGVTDIEVLKSIYVTKRFDESFVEYFMDTLERQLKLLHWHKLSVARSIPNSVLDNYNTSLTKLLKQRLSKLEYYTFMCAMLYSRRVENPILITNNSDISLENIKVFIPSPESKLSGGDSCNILGIETDIIPNIVYTTKIDDNKLIIDIPRMEAKEFFEFRVITRENAISISNIVESYQEKPSINKKRAWVVTKNVFIILMFLQFLLYHEIPKTDKPIEIKKIKKRPSTKH